MAPRKKVSKKSKTSWRKHTDVADIEEYLEEARRDERTGGSAREKADTDLYFVEKKGDKIGSVGAGKKRAKETPKQRKRNAALAEKVQKRKKTAKVLPSPSKDKVSSEEKPKGCPTFDLWSTPTEASITEVQMGKLPVKEPKHRTKKGNPAAIAAVQLPASGASYNPSYSDHQDLLCEANVVEVDKLRKREKIGRFAASLPVMDHFQREKTWVDEMSAGLQLPGEFPQDDGSESDDSFRGDEEAPAAPQIVRADYRKSLKQRRKEREQQEAAVKARLVKEARLKENEIYRIRSIKKEISREEADMKEKQDEKKKQPKAKKSEKLGPYRFEEPEIDVHLSEELAGSLRRLKPEGNLFRDRFHSLQRRKVIETRRRVIPHRKYKIRQYTKEDFKNDDWPLKKR